MSDEHSHLHAEIDVELAHVQASSDAPEDDEPEREPYETRLRSLHEAVVTQERTDRRD
ncbi:hypothetical protein ACW14X_25590 [Nocardioides sp. YJ-D4]